MLAIAKNHCRHRQMFEQVGQLRPAPGGVDILGREQPADVGVEVDEAEVEDQQTEQEAGDCQPQEAEQREQVVQRRVGPHGGVDTDRQGDDPGQDDGGDRDDHRQPEPVADDLGDRPLPLHGHTQVAAHHQAHPAHVLDIHRLIKRVLGAQLLRLIARDAAARGREIGDIGVDKVAGRQLDDGEGQHRDRPAGEQSEQDAADQVAEHGRTWVAGSRGVRGGRWYRIPFMPILMGAGC